MRTPPERRLQALLFDFDHTLTDFGRWVDWPAAREEIMVLYCQAGIDAAGVGRRHGAFGLLAALDEEVAARHSQAHADSVRSQAFGILERYEHGGAERARLLPGAATMLAQAAKTGLRVGIVSANAESAIRIALVRLGVEARFVAVVGRTPERPPKPAPDMHREALRLLGCTADAALAIGDSANDMRAAGAAGILAVGVLGGEGGAEALFAAGACYVLADLTALPSLLALWAEAAEAR